MEICIAKKPRFGLAHALKVSLSRIDGYKPTHDKSVFSFIHLTQYDDHASILSFDLQLYQMRRIY